MIRLAMKAIRATPRAVRRPKPPQVTPGGLPPRVVRQVAAERGTHRGAQLPIKRRPAGRGRGRRPLMRMWYMSLDTSAHCLVSTTSVGASSTKTIAEHISCWIHPAILFLRAASRSAGRVTTKSSPCVIPESRCSSCRNRVFEQSLPRTSHF